jgi:hypothetical protein
MRDEAVDDAIEARVVEVAGAGEAEKSSRFATRHGFAPAMRAVIIEA